MFDPRVATTYTNGTMIELDANDALNFLVGLAVTVIETIKNTTHEENKFGDKVARSKNSEVIQLIGDYNQGVPEAIYSCILQTNATILLNFVQDVVLNETTRGLYMFYHRSNHRNGKAPYDLIVKALEDVHQYYMEFGNSHYVENESKHYNMYNEEFLQLFEQ